MLTPCVHFPTYEAFVDAKEEVLTKLLQLTTEVLKPEDCQPTAILERFFQAWGAKAEGIWLWLCKGGSVQWARFMTARCVLAMRTKYGAVQKANTLRGLEFRHHNLTYVLGLLEEALKRLMGKKGPRSVLVDFEDHNFQKVKADADANARYVVKPVYSLERTYGEVELDADAKQRRIALMPVETVSKYMSAFEKGMERYITEVRTALDKEESASCLRFGGLAYKVKEHLREKGREILLQVVTRGAATVWCDMMKDLLVDMLEVACFSYARMNEVHQVHQQQQQQQQHLLVLLINERAGKNALGEFLGNEVRQFFKDNELKSVVSGEKAPCYLMQMAHTVNMPVMKAMMQDDVPMHIPRYYVLKLKKDALLFRIGMRRQRNLLSLLSLDLMCHIFKFYKQALANSEKAIEFNEAAYIGMRR